MPNCPLCEAKLDSQDPAGLCPQCLIRGAFDSSLGSDDAGNELTCISPAAADNDDFGKYHIVRAIGEGGMGTVYLAEQRDPIRRLVALKVVKVGMDTSQVLARFDNERQALAMMDHPNIAQIFDASATAKGRPYFVMEYIDGEPITQYCDQRRMTTRERLALFLAVCRAVQHAHQKGVIHRDLKPSNVLVTEQDGAPVPKVIDFGIAKATDKWAVENTLLTQFGQIVGTPEYASPEQADTMTGNIDESSDVYSLGVLLYELLIGALPFDTGTLRSVGLAEMLRIIREEEAPSLSRRLTSLGAAATDIAACRQTDLVSLRRLVGGDLNSITMRALEKARDRRYVSVSEFAADIQRYTEDRPVLASAQSRLYRARKLLRRHRLAALGLAPGVVFLVLSGVTVWALSHRESAPTLKLTDKDTIVLADFTNATRDPVFDETLRQGLAIQLEQSPFLSIIPDEVIQKTLGLMGQKADARLTPRIGQEICERTGSAAVLDGSIVSVGSQYVLGLRAKTCRTGEVLDEEQVQATRREDVLNALSKIAIKFRTKVGESLATVKQHGTPLEEATTTSIEALKAYSEAMKHLLITAQDVPSAVPLFQRAIEIDPKFAVAHASLGFTYGLLKQPALSAESSKKAYELRGRASDREKFFIAATYETRVTGNLEKALQTCELWVQAYPREKLPYGILGAFVYPTLGKYDKGVEIAKQLVKLDPDFAIGYLQLAFNSQWFGDLGQAEKTLQRASDRKLELLELAGQRYDMAFLKGDQAGMDREAALAQVQSPPNDMVYDREAFVLAYSGGLKEARRTAQRVANLNSQPDQRGRKALIEIGPALWDAFFGNMAAARKSAAAAADLSNDRDVEYGAAFALALSGESSRSRSLANDLEKRFPEDTGAKGFYLPAIRALLELNGGRPSKAIELLQPARPYDRGTPPSITPMFIGAFYTTYVRGLAYLAAQQGPEAAAEFQSIIDGRSIVVSDPVGALAHLQLGRALALSGDKARAQTAYEDFLALWKDADPDIPILKSAKAEYTKL
jgi:serine/threonine protein kinase/tetratricopeptide (TPR) repeat protein